MGGAQVQMARNRMQRWVRGRCQHEDGHSGNVCATLEGRRSPGLYPANRGREGKEASTGPGWKRGQSLYHQRICKASAEYQNATCSEIPRKDCSTNYTFIDLNGTEKLISRSTLHSTYL